MKNKIFLQYFATLISCLGACILLVVLPLWLVDESLGKGLMLGLPPMLLMVLSWMAGAWWAFDKDYTLFIAATIGATPLRMGLALAWAWMVVGSLPGINLASFVFGMMLYWTLFTVIEIAMMMKLSKLPRIE